jgi:hypothetical protein
MPKCVPALALGLVGGERQGPNRVGANHRRHAVIVGGIMLMIQSTKKAVASAKQGDGSGH